MQIFAFGHSIVHGCWDPAGGWVHRLRTGLDDSTNEGSEASSFEVYNLGIPGDDSDGLVARFDDEIARRVSDEEPSVVLFQIGANDVQYLRDERRVRVPADRFESNLEVLLGNARCYTDDVVFVGEAYVTIDGPIPWAPEIELSDDRLGEYERRTREICEREAVPYVDVRSTATRSEWERVLTDGCHPNDEGHRRISREVRATLADNSILDDGV